MKIPNLASPKHAGVGRLSTESQVGSKFCAANNALSSENSMTTKRNCFIESPLNFHSGLCDQSQSFSFGVVAHCAGRVKVHRCPLLRSVCGPMRQAVVIRTAGSGKIYPGSTDLLR